MLSMLLNKYIPICYIYRITDVVFNPQNCPYEGSC